MKELSPAEKVINAAGGITKLSEHLRKDRTWVWRWTQPRIKGGTDGDIPPGNHRLILKLSVLHGWGITAADIIG